MNQVSSHCKHLQKVALCDCSWVTGQRAALLGTTVLMAEWSVQNGTNILKSLEESEMLLKRGRRWFKENVWIKAQEQKQLCLQLKMKKDNRRQEYSNFATYK